MVSYTYTPEDIRTQLRKNIIIYQCLKCGERVERDIDGKGSNREQDSISM